MINLKNLNKNFGNTEIYKEANYKFKENSLTCFLGASGSGKTTLLNLIAGFDTDYTGEIIVNGIDLKKLKMDELCQYRCDNIGFIFQNYNLLKGYTALENILMGVHLNSAISEGEKVRRALELLESLGLESQINQKIETLSGGQKQRVSIARAIINEPKIILADEPTGALDSESTKSIMEILKKISKKRTVVIITHDEEVAEYADEVIELEDYNIRVKRSSEDIAEVAITDDKEKYNGREIKSKLSSKIATKLSLKNFKIHIFKFIISAIIIAFGSSAFVSSLSSKDITNKIIEDFKTKNVFYNIGQVPLYDDGKKIDKDINSIFDKLSDMEKVENVYYQYNLENIEIVNADKSIKIPIKMPTITAKETMAYGNMPEKGKKEIAMASNVANRLVDDIKTIIGKKVVLKITNKDGNIEEVTLTVSGLTNSQYQDFILSTDTEKEIYDIAKVDKENPAAISFYIKYFDDIPVVDSNLRNDDIGVFTKAAEVEVFKKSFSSLLKLYTAISYLILGVGILISIIMLYKVSIERYIEVGLLGALGYRMKNIKDIMFRESVYFAGLSTVVSCLLIILIGLVYKIQFGYGLNLNIKSFVILIGLNLILTMVITSIINIKLIKTEPAEALRK